MPDASPAPATAPPSEPELIGRERAALRQILRLVAERAEAEAEVEGTRATGDTTADAEYQRAKQTLQEKVERLERDGRSGDELRRRSIIDAGMKGESEAKNEFAASSRRIATEFDRARETARNESSRAKSEIAASFDGGQLKAAKEHSTALKPILELIAMADGHRERLAAVAADYAKFGLNAEPPIASEENYSKFADPVRRAIQPARPDGNAPEAARGPAHPEVDEGQSRSLDLHRGDRADARDRRGRWRRLGRRRWRCCRRGGLRGLAANLARQALQRPARTALSPAHAIAGRCR